MTNDRNGQRVLIAGAGFAGLGAAYALRAVAPEVQINVVDPHGNFTFAPSLIWAAFGKSMTNSTFNLEAALLPRNIRFIRSQVQDVRPADHVLTTNQGEIGYDRLIIATGGRPSAHAIPGLAGEFRAANWIVGEDSAMDARTLIERLFSDTGPAVVGAAQGSSYVSAADELALLLDSEARKRGLRNQIPITFITGESTLGDFGFGKDVAGKELAGLYAQRGIETRAGMEITSVSSAGVQLSSGETLAAKAAIIMPPITGSPDIWKSTGLTDDRGLVPIRPDYRHVDHEDIYAAGMASYFAQPLPPLPAARTPHTGYLSLHMGKIAGRNVAAALGHAQPAEHPFPYILDVRVIDGGDSGIVSASWGRSALHSQSLAVPGGVAHGLKLAVERYLVSSLRSGRVDLV